jgi:hypothetical protein
MAKTQISKAVTKAVKVTETPKAKAFSKTSRQNLDNIIDMMISEFCLKESEVKKFLKEKNVLPRNSRLIAKKKKDKDAPTGPRSAYILFTMEKRPELKKKFPALKTTEYSPKFGEMWAKLSDKKKKPYEDKAAVDKVRAKKEKDEYEAENPDKVPSKEKKIAHQDDPDYVMGDKGKMVKRRGKQGIKILAALAEENDDSENDDSENDDSENDDSENDDDDVKEVADDDVKEVADDDSDEDDSDEEEEVADAKEVEVVNDEASDSSDSDTSDSDSDSD